MSVIYKSGKWTVVDNITSRVVSTHKSRQDAREANAAYHKPVKSSTKSAPTKCKDTSCKCKEPDLSFFDELQIMAANLKLAIDKFAKDAHTAAAHYQTAQASAAPEENPKKRRIFGRTDGTWDIFLGGKYQGSTRDIESARLGMRYLKSLGYLPEQDVFFKRK